MADDSVNPFNIKRDWPEGQSLNEINLNPFMEKNNEEHLLKIRSARAIVLTGFRLYLGNFRRILRFTWLPALLCALVSALYTNAIISAMPQLLAGIQQAAQGSATPMLTQGLLLTGISLLLDILLLLLLSYAFSLLSRHRSEGAIPYPARWISTPDWRMLMRTIGIALIWMVAISIAIVIPTVVIGVGLSLQSLTMMGTGLLLLLATACLLLPLVYPSMRYLSTRDTRLFDILFKGYRQGLRYWSTIFVIVFIIILIALVILTVITLPAIVLFIANMQAQAGILMGDPLGMPSYMGWLAFLVFTLSGFIEAYVILSLLFPLYYMAGTIEQHEIQRNEKSANTLY